MMVKLAVNEDNWKDALPIVVMHYRDMEMMEPGTPLLKKIRKQYADMAQGGDGGPVSGTPNIKRERFIRHYPSVRSSSYPDAPNEFFQELCDLLGWAR